MWVQSLKQSVKKLWSPLETLGDFWRVLKISPKCHNLSFIYSTTIVQTGIACKKILCYIRDSACRCLLLKKLKYFEVMLNISFFFLLLRLLMNRYISLYFNETKNKNKLFYLHCYCKTSLSKQVRRIEKWTKKICQINQEILKALKNNRNSLKAFQLIYL